MSYAGVKAGLIVRLNTVIGLNVKLAYEPNSIQDAPAIYTILDSFERTQEGQLTIMRYRSLHRLWIRWQDNEAAENQMDSYVNAIPASIDLDPHLGGSLPVGIAYVSSGVAEWRTMGDVLYRTIDFFSEAVEKGIYQSGTI